MEWVIGALVMMGFWLIFFGGVDVLVHGLRRLFHIQKMPTLFDIISISPDQELERWWQATHSDKARIKNLEAALKESESGIRELKEANSSLSKRFPYAPNVGIDFDSRGRLTVFGQPAVVIPEKADQTQMIATLKRVFEKMVQTAESGNYVIPSMGFRGVETPTLSEPAKMLSVPVIPGKVMYLPEGAKYQELTPSQHREYDSELMRNHGELTDEQYQKFRDEIGW